jgi:prepilin-type N-terminal cleavage/methylation domain-containing protein/prepilin-type processing-associated H-X9-DG protein
MKRTLHKSGFTLVELLVVVTIIAILIALLLPAVQMAREAARKTECNNHIKQLALACLTHEQQHRILPTGGWAYWWLGDPDRGFDHHQCGGWIYNILPYIEQTALREIGAGMNYTAKRAALVRVAQSPLNVLHCPTRRQAILYPNTYTQFNVDAYPGGVAARTDYGGNAGTCQDFWHFPYSTDTDPAKVDIPSFKWPSVMGFDGIFYPISELHMSDISDGLSNTYLIGEKHLNPDAYLDGSDAADNNPIYEGYDWDICRWSVPYLGADGKTHYSVPVRDMPGLSNSTDYGSAHPTSFNISFCDGSVRTISYNINEVTHLHFCQRADGVPIDDKTVE